MPVVDYGEDYPNATGRILTHVTYAELRAGVIEVDGQQIQSVPMSSLGRAREIAATLKTWIEKGEFLLGEPVDLLPSCPRHPYCPQQEDDFEEIS